MSIVLRVAGSKWRRYATISFAPEPVFAAFSAARISWHLAVETSIGFSVSTWMPAFRAGTMNSACRQFGVAR